MQQKRSVVAVLVIASLMMLLFLFQQPLQGRFTDVTEVDVTYDAKEQPMSAGGGITCNRLRNYQIPAHLFSEYFDSEVINGEIAVLYSDGSGGTGGPSSQVFVRAAGPDNMLFTADDRLNSRQLVSNLFAPTIRTIGGGTMLAYSAAAATTTTAKRFIRIVQPASGETILGRNLNFYDYVLSPYVAPQMLNDEVLFFDLVMGVDGEATLFLPWGNGVRILRQGTDRMFNFYDRPQLLELSTPSPFVFGGGNGLVVSSKYDPVTLPNAMTATVHDLSSPLFKPVPGHQILDLGPVRFTSYDLMLKMTPDGKYTAFVTGPVNNQWVSYQQVKVLYAPTNLASASMLTILDVPQELKVYDVAITYLEPQHIPMVVAWVTSLGSSSPGWLVPILGRGDGTFGEPLTPIAVPAIGASFHSTLYPQVLANVVNGQPVIDFLWNGWDMIYDYTSC